MSDSIYQMFFTGVFIFVFVIATTITITLFTTVTTYSEKAYEYGKLTSNDSIIEVSSDVKDYNIVSGTELLSYKYNYVDNNKYGDQKPDENYIFTLGDKVLNSKNFNIDLTKNYILEYVGYTAENKIPTINIRELVEE